MKFKNLKDYLNSEIEFYEYANENFLDFLSSIKFSLDIPFIQVTGTSGKSAIVNMLSNVYEANGYNIGRFIANDMLNFSCNDEKYQGFAAIFETYWKQINKFELTKYEVLFFLNLISFKKIKKIWLF